MKSSGAGKGCTYAIIAVAVVGALAVIGIIAGLAFLGNEVADEFDEAIDDDPCPFLSDADARAVFGDGVEAIELSGLNQLLEITGDNRVLANPPACIVRASSGSYETIARVARYQGSDAASVFDAERDVADGTSQDQGGGISLETSAYLSDQAVESGDEGFCTTANIMGASGALVRQGDTLVYVSVQPDFTSETPQVDLDSGGFATDPENCAKAQDLAERILG